MAYYVEYNEFSHHREKNEMHSSVVNNLKEIAGLSIFGMSLHIVSEALEP